MNKRFSDKFTYISITCGIVFTYIISSLFIYLYNSTKQDLLNEYYKCFYTDTQDHCVSYLFVDAMLERNEFYLIFSGINSIISALLIFVFFFIYSSCKAK